MDLERLRRLRAGGSVGRFTLKELLGSGASAQVWLATENTSRGATERVLKVLHPELAEDASHQAMFIDEAKTGLMLRHPNLQAVYGLMVEDGLTVMVMEAQVGVDLSRVLHASPGGKIGWRPAAVVGQQVARALDYAHSKRDRQFQPLDIVHRDVSPDNVLVAEDGSVKLLDFGVVWSRDRLSVTEAGVTKGKLSYLAPEVVGQGTFDRRSDIYALGAVLWQAMAGALPWGHPQRVDEVALRGVPPPLLPENGDLPVALRRLTTAMLSPEPGPRPASMGDVDAELSEILFAEGIDEVSARELVGELMGPSLHPRTMVGASLRSSAAVPDTALRATHISDRDEPGATSASASKSALGARLEGDPRAHGLSPWTLWGAGLVMVVLALLVVILRLRAG